MYSWIGIATIMRFIYTKTFIRIFAIFVLLGGVIILDSKGYLGGIKDLFNHAYGFGVTGLTAATNSVKNGFSTLFTIKNLVTENAKLSQQVDELAFENSRLRSAQNENVVLRSALNFEQQSNLKLIPLEVISSDVTGFDQVIIVDKGQTDGLIVNEPVVVQPG